MYNIINVIVHVLGIFLIVFSLITDKQYHKTDMTLKTFTLMLGIGLLSFWAMIIGSIDNIKSLIALVW